MRAVDILRKKRDGLPLSAAEIEAFVQGAARREWPDYQLSALLMAVVLRGMDPEETAGLTGAMVRSGATLDWPDLPGPVVDKHSTGGVGDKTSLVLLPLAVACGVFVPMLSGRGLGHTGGTLDKMEAIPGFRTLLSLDELRKAVRAVGGALASPTPEIAPADGVLYALRDVTATVESIPLISASILCKKLAEGITALVMDVKCGGGAFMKTLPEARELARSMLAIAGAHGVKMQAVLTAMDAPLGRAVGNALEVAESIAVLSGGGPEDVRDLSVSLAARMVWLGGAAPSLSEAEGRVRSALESGRGLEVFGRIVAQQGGDSRVTDDPSLLPAAPHREVLRADRSGYAGAFDALRVGVAAQVLGAGRGRVEDRIDPAVGLVVLARAGEPVKAGDGLIELHYRDPARLAQALEVLAGACPVLDAPPAAGPLVLEVEG
jgi:pyrimidine-nucleoside phosphorylase